MHYTFYIFLAIAVPLAFFIVEYVFYTAKRQQALDLARVSLFKIRNDLFLYSLEHGLEEKEASYAIRKRINTYIRFVHKADLITYVVFNKKIENDKNAARDAKKITKEINRLINSLPEKNRAYYMTAIENGRLEILRFMVYSSPFLSLIFHCVKFGFNSRSFFDKNKEKFSKNLDLEISSTFASV